jgi:hypothetical protein
VVQNTNLIRTLRYQAANGDVSVAYWYLSARKRAKIYSYASNQMVGTGEGKWLALASPLISILIEGFYTRLFRGYRRDQNI